eukprot:182777-Amorphochlora_amoeboformis.AAC.1
MPTLSNNITLIENYKASKSSPHTFSRLPLAEERETEKPNPQARKTEEKGGGGDGRGRREQSLSEYSRGPGGSRTIFGESKTPNVCDVCDVL